MKFSSFLQEGLYDKFFDIPNQIKRIWKTTGTRSKVYSEIENQITAIIHEKTGIPIRIVFAKPDISYNNAGGWYDPEDKTIVVVSSSTEGDDHLSHIISVIMHELTHALQYSHKDAAFIRHQAMGSGSNRKEELAKYFFQNAEFGPGIAGYVSSFFTRGMELGKVKQFLYSCFKGNTPEDRYQNGQETCADLNMFSSLAGYATWGTLIAALAYGYNNPKYHSRAVNYVERLIREYGNFIYLQKVYK